MRSWGVNALCLVLLLGGSAVSPLVAPARAASVAIGSPGPDDLLLDEHFDAITSDHPLPSGWWLGPSAHRPYLHPGVETEIVGERAPSVHLELAPAALNYYLTTPRIPLSTLGAGLVFEGSLGVRQPDSPFLVEAMFWDSAGAGVAKVTVLDLPGSTDTTLRRFRVALPPRPLAGSGSVSLAFGLPYAKIWRAGDVWLDDISLRREDDGDRSRFYLTPRSVAPGDVVEVHGSARAGLARLRIDRETSRPIPVDSVSAFAVEPRAVPAEAWARGCAWPVSCRFTVGPSWPSGLYTVRLITDHQEVSQEFVVRGRGDEGPVLVILPTNTTAAYNGFGGGSFYSNPQRPVVSFERPDDVSTIGAYFAPIHLLRWLTQEGIGFGVATDTDLNDRPELLRRYAGLILCGHSEYWTRPMRANVEDCLAAGKSVICLSGNTCWWQARLEEAGADEGVGSQRRLVCYKYSAEADPIGSIDPSLVTTRWDQAPLNEPPTRLLGISYRYGGLVNWSTSYDCPCPYDWLTGHGGYTVTQPEHWVFAGTGVTAGEVIGRSCAIVGYEVDGVPLQWADGHPVPSGDVGTPDGFNVLGWAPAWNQLRGDSSGVAVMGILERDDGAFVFNGGTTGWCWGLTGDPVVQQVTRNLIDRLGSNPGRTAPRPRVRLLPNPCSDVARIVVEGRPLATTATIWTAAGRRAGTVPLRPTWVSTAEGAWSARDERGGRSPSGVYWVRVPGRPATRLVLMH